MNKEIELLTKQEKEAYKEVKRLKNELRSQGIKKDYMIKHLLRQTPEYATWKELVDRRTMIISRQLSEERGFGKAW